MLSRPPLCVKIANEVKTVNRNQLKIIACVSMLIDHIGFVLFPDITALRLVGRIAMPIFAFFIGEGCLYTKNRRKYFLRVFVLGLLCQAVYVAESLITKSGNWAYFNILLTFSLSIVLCSAFVYLKNTLENGGRNEKIKGVILFSATLAAVVSVHIFCKNSWAVTGTKFEFDYGIYGICLPLFAAVSKNKKTKLLCFGLALTVCSFTLYESIYFRLCALIPVFLLAFYNGKSGKANLKYFFYAFYPAHLAIIYLIDLLR